MSDKKQIEVHLRPWSRDYLPLLECLMGDPAMTEHLGGPENPEKIRERNERYSENLEPGMGAMFVIVAGQEAAAAGSVGYWPRKWHGELVWETGWSVLPEFQCQGIATNATRLVIEKARAENSHRFLHAFPSAKNGPSNAICRKVGFTLEGEVDFEYPLGNLMRCNNWRLDLFAIKLESLLD